MPISSSETPSSAAEDFGPYFFAWCDEGDAFDSALHTRFDDDIFEFKLDHQEGNFAALSITVLNPRIGLLAPGRQIWAWFSWWNGVEAVPLFKGRLIGLPDNIADDTVTLNFIARPSDFVSQQQAVADSLKVRPYWDSIWFSPISPDDQSAATTATEANNVLEARPELWFTDPVSHVVSTSNIVAGEDGTLNFTSDDIFYDSVKLNYTQNPLRSVQMSATVSWDQMGTGVVTPPNLGASGNFRSYTGQGLAAGWPTKGASIGGGWSWKVASAIPTGMVDSALVGTVVYNGLLGNPTTTTRYADGGFDTSLGTWGTNGAGQNIGWSYHVAIPNINVAYTLGLEWTANRRKTEVLTFTLNADVQDILTLPDDGETLKLSMSSSELNGPIDPGGAIPLGRQTARYYFTTARGAQSIEFLIAVARAHLLARARCVNIDFEVPFETAVAAGLSLRKNAIIHDSRLPGTNVGGKIKAWSLGLSNGLQTAAVAIGCCVGTAGSVSPTAGSPDYCEVDYVDGWKAEQASSDLVSEAASDILNEVRYQTYTGEFALPFASDIAYESILGWPCNDDGIDLDHITSHAVRVAILNGNGDGETQQDALNRFSISVDAGGKVTATNTRYAQLSVTVPDLTNGPFETDYALNVTTLKIPKDIDLGAASEGVSS